MSFPLPLPFRWEELSEEEEAARSLHFASQLHKSMVRSVPGGVVLPSSIRDEGFDRTFFDFELRKDDIWIVTFPKCGTTWAQEMIWQITRQFDPVGGQTPLFLRTPFLEMRMLSGPKKDTDPPFMDGVGLANILASPRVIKTHLPLEMLPPNLLDTCKVIYVCRNPKDCCVSYYHHSRLASDGRFVGSFDVLADMFKKGLLMIGSYWDHLAGGWRNRNHPNMTFLWYEDMKRDLGSIIRLLCDRLGYDLDDATIRKLEEHLAFENFQKNPAVNFEVMFKEGKFIRKGIVGDWKNYFSQEKGEEWDRWIEENKKRYDIDVDFKQTV